jgi:hypothetical protein
MDHIEAQEKQAVERYILFEMKPDERDAFEEHFFDCRVCADDVRESARLVAAGRTVARDTANVVSFRRSWTAWIPAAAAAVLVIIAAGLYVPRRSSPSLERTQRHDIYAGMARGDSESSIELRANAVEALSIDIEPNMAYARYEVVVRDSSKRAVATYRASADEAKNSIDLLLGSLPAGSYVLAIEGVDTNGNRTGIAAHPLKVR